MILADHRCQPHPLIRILVESGEIIAVACLSCGDEQCPNCSDFGCDRSCFDENSANGVTPAACALFESKNGDGKEDNKP